MSDLYICRRLRAEALPGKILYDHPADTTLEAHQRIWRVLQAIMPNGDIQPIGVAGPWGEAYDEQAFDAAAERCLAQAAADEDAEAAAISVLTREYRLEARGD